MADVKIEFSIDPEKAFNDIKKGLQAKALRNGVSKGSAVVREAMASRAPRRTGNLAKSLKIRVKAYQDRSIFAGVIGPKSSYVRLVGKYTRGPHKGEPKRVRPSKYAHLVVRGHGGPHAAGPKDFITPAVTSSRSAYEQALVSKVKETIADGLRK